MTATYNDATRYCRELREAVKQGLSARVLAEDYAYPLSTKISALFTNRNREIITIAEQFVKELEVSNGRAGEVVLRYLPRIEKALTRYEEFRRLKELTETADGCQVVWNEAVTHYTELKKSVVGEFPASTDTHLHPSDVEPIALMERKSKIMIGKGNPKRESNEYAEAVDDIHAYMDGLLREHAEPLHICLEVLHDKGTQAISDAGGIVHMLEKIGDKREEYRGHEWLIDMHNTSTDEALLAGGLCNLSNLMERVFA